MVFKDRNDAGRKLAEKLRSYQHENPIVLAIPRGGVVLGYEVAKALKAPLDIIITRKLGAPGQPELGIGAIAPNGIRVLNTEVIQWLGVSQDELEAITQREQQELNRRLQRYRGDRPMPDIQERTVILIDDGLATGITARASIQALKQMQPRKLVLAVPVSSPETADALRPEVDELVCLETPPDFFAVGAHYQEFEQVTDQEVIDLLARARQEIQVT